MTTHIEEKISKGFIHFSAILEIVGKPKEHVDETFATFISQMKKSIKFDIVKDTVHEAIAVDGSENLFSSFAEIEVLAKNMGALYDFCFECMPASVEILAPSELKLKPNQASAAVNDLIGRIHNLDMQSKQLTQQINLYSANLRIMIENAIVIYLAAKPRRLEEISAVVGVAPAQIPTFLNDLITKGKISETNGIYGIAGKEIKQHVASGDAALAAPKKEEVISVGAGAKKQKEVPSSKSKNKAKNKKA